MTEDIAGVAFWALTDEESQNTDHRVLGPELLTHDQIAEKLSAGLGRNIEHVKLSEEESTERWKGMGLPEELSKFMTGIEISTANGTEDMVNDVVERVTGKPPKKFQDWVAENKPVWV